MNDEIARAIAKDNAISIEAKVRSYSKRADGGINIGLAVHPHGIPSGMREIEIGDRFYVAMFQIDDNEQSTTGKEASEQTFEANPKPASADPPGRAPNKLVQLAGMLSKTPLFHRYLEVTSGLHNIATVDEKWAAEIIRIRCGVASRSQIVAEDISGKRFLNLYDDFIRWRDSDKYVEAS